MIVTEASLPTVPAPLCQLIAAVLGQTADGDSASLARLAASEALAYAQAQAVSILGASGEIIQARTGQLPAAVQAKLDAWERALVKTVRQGSTELPNADVPVSVAQTDGWTACMVPLVAGRQVVGALSLCVEPAREAEAIHAAQALSPWLGTIMNLAQGMEPGKRHLAVSMQNETLFPTSAEAAERIVAMQRSLREEIASALHQGAIQLLAAVAMGMDHLGHLVTARPEALPDEINSLKKMTREASREARLLLAELNPASLESGGLKTALESYIQQMPDRGEKVSFQSSGPIAQVDAIVARTAFHVVVQALRHAYAHGSAAHAWLSLSLEDEKLSVEIEDDGIPQTERRCSRHDQELDCAAYIRQQLRLVRGTLDICAEPDRSRPALLIQIPARVS